MGKDGSTKKEKRNVEKLVTGKRKRRIKNGKKRQRRQGEKTRFEK